MRRFATTKPDILGARYEFTIEIRGSFALSKAIFCTLHSLSSHRVRMKRKAGFGF